MSQVLTADDFMPFIGKTFTPKGQHRALTLTSVDTKASAGWEGMTRQPFTLILRGPPDDVLPEGLYDVAVEDGPEFALYIIPIQTMSRDRQDYQVVFN
jgi:hypothetical protein